jgi:hypothetical protein
MRTGRGVRVLVGLVAGLTFAGVVHAAAARALDWPGFFTRVSQSLVRQSIIDPARVLVHLSHVCDVRVAAGPSRHVVEVRELVPGGPSPRGVNQLVLLDGRLRVLDHIELTTAHAMYCDAGQVVLDLPVESVGLSQSGNVLSVDGSGKINKLSSIEAAQMRGMARAR